MDVRVSPLNSVEVGGTAYDAVLATVGFETRARFVFESLPVESRESYASGFNSRQSHDFAKNRRFFCSKGFEYTELSDSDYVMWVSDALAALDAEGAGPIRLCFDISSTSRLRMAAFIAAAMKLANDVQVSMDFVYSLAKFSRPQTETAPITHAGPVQAAFAGWPADPDDPVAAIFGLGYEYERAVGVLEYLDPAEVWAFEPTEHDPRYAREIEKANETFYDGLPSSHLIQYPVTLPFELFVILESFVYGILRLDKRPILIPFGPKIFSLASLIVSCVHWPRVPVWRVSAGELGQAANRTANGMIECLRVTFSPNDAVASASS